MMVTRTVTASMTLMLTGLWSGVSGDYAEGADSQMAIREEQIAETSHGLRRAIEENYRLASENQQLQARLQNLQTETISHARQLDSVQRERDDLSRSIQQAENQKQEFLAKIEKLQSGLQDENVVRPGRVDFELAQARAIGISTAVDANGATPASPEDVLNREAKTLDLLSRIDAFAEQDEKLRADAARAHYNMGNIYFQKGDYEIAAREYYQAMVLMPDDPDVHYNLAFVSGEHLRDFRTALKHYRMYLYLNPNAKDKHLVKEKVIELELIMRQITNSPLEKQDKYQY